MNWKTQRYPIICAADAAVMCGFRESERVAVLFSSALPENELLLWINNVFARIISKGVGDAPE